MILEPPPRLGFPHPGNASDERDCLCTLDHWLTDGTINQNNMLDEVIREQAWPLTTLQEITRTWHTLTGYIPGQGSIDRGHGWRCWYADGRILDSRTDVWGEIPDQIVLGVSYRGESRYMFQGQDPFWMDLNGFVHDLRTNYPDGHTNPRWELVARIQRGELSCTIDDKLGVWVPDKDMQRIRLLACLAFIL